MSNIPRSLSTYLPAQQLLRLLGVRPREDCLPTVCKCPICDNGSLQLYADNLIGGEWFHCRHCDSGDMIELAAETWRLNIPTAIGRLRQYGFSVPGDGLEIQKYMDRHVGYRQRLNELWQRAPEYLWNCPDSLQRVVHAHNLYCSVSQERWLSGPGGLMGGANTVTVERAFAPASMQHADEIKQRNNPSNGAVFRGENWDDVLVIPHYDLPGRICAFLFIGRSGNPDSDFVFKRANMTPNGGMGHTEPFEAGLALHPRTLDIAGEWNDRVIAVRNPVVALQLQTRHFEQSTLPVPLVVFHDEPADRKQRRTRPVRTNHAWTMLGKTAPVFWMPHYDYATLRQAISLNASICTIGPQRATTDDMKQYIWRFRPRDWARTVLRTAKPWARVLDSIVRSMTSDEVRDLLIALEADGVEVDQKLFRCDERTQRRAREVFPPAGMNRTVTYDLTHTVVEKRDGWWGRAGRSGHEFLISSAVLRVEHLVVHRRSKRTAYAGHILVNGRRVRFCEWADVVDADTLRWMHNVLLKHGHVPIGNRNWSKHMLEIAKRFHQPTVVDAIESVGWNAAKFQFDLPLFSVAPNREVEPNRFPDLLPGGLPARHLQPPVTMSPEEAQRPEQYEELTGLYWALVASVVSNIIAPTRGQQPSGIAVAGTGAIAMCDSLTRGMGCLTCRADTAAQVRDETAKSKQHGWPTRLSIHPRVHYQPRRELYDRWSSDHRNLVLDVDPVTARVLAMTGGWHVVRGDQPVEVPSELESLAATFVPAYLREFCDRNLHLDHWANPLGSLVEEVLRDMARFIETQGGDGDTVLRAFEVLWPDRGGGNGDAMGELLALLSGKKRMRVVREAERAAASVLVRLNDGSGVLLRCAPFVKVLRSLRVPIPARDKLCEALAEANALVDDREEGPVIRLRWLLKQFRRAASLNIAPLRVVG